MYEITDADREAAERLRIVLADICGFWHQAGDASPLCIALARHRAEAEERMVATIVPLTAVEAAQRCGTAAGRHGLLAAEAASREAILHHR